MLEDLSKKLNIDLVGITDAKRLSSFENLLMYRDENELSTEFEDKNIEKRIVPSLHLNDVNSIIVIGMSYNYESSNGDKFKISNHARGYDYHKVVGNKLEELAEALSEHLEFQYKIQVDTGSLLERVYGNLAGIGYFGKNSCLINDEFGSYISLGLLLTTVPYENDGELLESECGECNICIKSCPSGAIRGDYTINSRSCHSYLTQSKSKSSEVLNIKYAYGCDICQLVCPKNKDIKVAKYNYEIPLKASFDVDEISEMSNKEFKRRFKNYSFSWVGRKIILRNLEILEKG